MEKLIYALWRDPDEGRASFNANLMQVASSRLRSLVRGLRVNLQDETVAAGTSPRFVVTRPQMEAVVQVWLDTAYAPVRAPVEAALAEVAARVEGWLVAESAPLPNSAHPSQPGQRTAGFSQIVFLSKPQGMDFDTWRSHWQHDHTRVAVETQSSFEYVQNLVVRPLTKDAMPFVAMIEESFPLDALTDEHVFWDSAGNAKVLEAHRQREMDSCARFIGPEGCDVIPTSQFDVKSAFNDG